MIEVTVSNAHPERRVAAPAVRRLVRGLLRKERRRHGAVSVVFAGDALSRRMNRSFLSHDRPTDVLSFSLGEGQNLEGEIYVNLDRAARQARRYRVSAANEVARLVIHGVLHLLGYDDKAAAAARRMKYCEDRYVELLAGKGIHPR